MTSRLRWLHRWIGLTLGSVLVLICSSGTALLFQAQLFRWAHGELIPPALSPEVGSIDAWVSNSRAAAPDLPGPFYIWAPHSRFNISDAAMLLYKSEPKGFGKLGYTAVLVSPATAEVLGLVDLDRSPAYVPIFLHGRLGVGRPGLWIVAIVAVATVLLLAIGLYLWWPPRHRLMQKLTPLPWRSTFSYAGRLHDWAGAWSSPLLLVVAVTGIYMARADWLEPALRLLPGEATHASAPMPGSCTGPIGFDEAIARAGVPGELVAIEAVDRADRVQRRWELVFKPPGAASVAQETHVEADLGCGTLAVAAAPGKRTARDAARMGLRGLHDGTLFGFPGEVFVSVLGLVPLVLAWSGIRRWLRSRRARTRGA